MKDICCAMIANPRYQKYIPIYSYSLLRAYPDYSVYFYITGNLRKKVKDALTCMSDMGDVQVKERCFEWFSGDQQQFKTIRWILYDKVFEEFKSIYIGDMDTIVCREDVGIFKQHMDDCKLSGLPYSNCIRSGTKRIIGRHFVVTKPYFEGIEKVRRRYKKKLRDGTLHTGSNDEGKGNEWILYNMIKKSGIGLPKRGREMPTLISGHHGIHLGIFRTRVARYKVSALRLEYYRQFLQMKEDKTFQEIMRLVPLIEVKHLERAFKRDKWHKKLK